MPFAQFLGYTFAGTMIWSTFLVLLGYYLGQNREEIVVYLKKYDHYMLYAVAIGLLLFVLRRIRKNSKK